MEGIMKRPTTYIGWLIQTIRQKQELTQAELAKRSGIPQATISRIESGKHKMPVITTIQRAIARVLGDGSQAREVEIFLQLT
jgi:transcriptional regulator with XRE-family HTH domain